MICEVVKGLIIGLVVFMIAVGLTWMIYGSPLENKPTAMDVYQGKTTLEITYKDSLYECEDKDGNEKVMEESE